MNKSTHVGAQARETARPAQGPLTPTLEKVIEKVGNFMDPFLDIACFCMCVRAFVCMRACSSPSPQGTYSFFD